MTEITSSISCFNSDSSDEANVYTCMHPAAFLLEITGDTSIGRDTSYHTSDILGACDSTAPIDMHECAF